MGRNSYAEDPSNVAVKDVALKAVRNTTMDLCHSLIVGMTQQQRSKGVLSRFGALSTERVPMTGYGT